MAVTDELTFNEICPVYEPMDVIPSLMVWGDCA